MQTVILAGGLGTRLSPLTKTIPKPMVTVAGVPYLEHQLRALAGQNLRDVLLLTGHFGEQIQAHFGTGEKLGMHLEYSREPAPMGTGGALRHARSQLQDAFLVIYGDSYLPIRYRDAFERLQEVGTEGLLVVYDNALGDTSVKNNVDLDEAGFVSCYEKDSPIRLGYVEAGVLALRRSVVDLIPEGRPASLEKEVFPHLIRRKQLAALVTAQRFYDIGTPERLALIESVLASAQKR
jgi:NDP-sugar pyrophosphorylase family protein